jgi:hypothetical protein
MKCFPLCINVITGITLTVLYIPFFILLNEQDSSYERIYDGVSLNGVHYYSIIAKLIMIFNEVCL